MKIVDIVEKIEGEAKLVLDYEDGIIDDARIEFLNFRGFEYILKDKPLLDALIFTPRICGICNQAHLYACVKALEDIYTQNNEELLLTNKAIFLRELGVGLEILSSHIRWYYFFLMSELTKNSELFKYYSPLYGKKWKKAQQISHNILKSLAIFAGQWPHSSYMVVGGVMSDITFSEILFIKNSLLDIKEFFLEEIYGISENEYLNLNSSNFEDNINGDLKDFFEIIRTDNYFESGEGFNRFLSIGENLNFKRGKFKNSRYSKIQLENISENDEFTFKVDKDKNDKEYGWAKRALYKDEVYETGPLSRALISNDTLIKSLHLKDKDKAHLRVIARINEIYSICDNLLSEIENIDIKEQSYTKPKVDLKNFNTTTSIGTVEAARGSLIHKIKSANGIIKHYDIITPTVWNLSSGDKKNPGVAQNAIIGSKTKEEAEFILRSYDVCSVCTTH